MDLLKVLDALTRTYDYEAAVAWLESKNADLNGQRPIDLSMTGAGPRCWRSSSRWRETPDALDRLAAPTTGQTLTASLLNLYRENINDLHRRTTQVSASVLPAGSTASTTYAHLDLSVGGPAVTVEIGSTGKCNVSIKALISSDNVNLGGWASIALSGANTLAASDEWALAHSPSAVNAGASIGCMIPFSGLAPGLTTFTMMYRVHGTPAIMAAMYRFITATPLGS